MLGALLINLFLTVMVKGVSEQVLNDKSTLKIPNSLSFWMPSTTVYQVRFAF